MPVEISERALRTLFFGSVSLYAYMIAWYQITRYIGFPGLLLNLFLSIDNLPEYLDKTLWNDAWNAIYMGYSLSAIPMVATFAFLIYLEYQGVFTTPEPVTVYIPLLNGKFLTLSDTKTTMEVAVGLPIEWKHFWSFMGWNIMDTDKDMSDRRSAAQKSVNKIQNPSLESIE